MQNESVNVITASRPCDKLITSEPSCVLFFAERMEISRRDVDEYVVIHF